MIFKKKIIHYCENEYMDREVNAEYIEEIADQYAIKFAEWCAYYQIYQIDSKWRSNLLTIANHYETYTMKQLLIKFKGEINED